MKSDKEHKGAELGKIFPGLGRPIQGNVVNSQHRGLSLGKLRRKAFSPPIEY